MKEIFKTYTKPTLIFVGILLIIFFPVVFQGGEIFGTDIISLDEGLIYSIIKSIKSGYYPHVLMDFSSATPFNGAYPSLYYPFFWIYFFFDYTKAFTFILLINYIIGFLGLYAVGRYFRLNIYGCFLGGFIFSLNGFLFESQGQPTMVFATAWIPWIFLYSNKLIEKLSLKHTILLTLILVLDISASRLDYLYFTFIFVYIWFSLSIVFKNINIKEKKLNFTILLISQVLSLLVMSFMLLPLSDGVAQSNRNTGVHVNEAIAFSLNPQLLLNFVFDKFYGESSFQLGALATDYKAAIGINDGLLFHSFYIGIPIAILAIYPLFYLKQRKEVKSIFIILILFLFFAMGKFINYDFYLYFYSNFPFLKNMRFPVKFVSIIMFCISILSMFSVEFIYTELEKKIYRFSNTLLLLLILFTGILLSAKIFDEQIKNFASEMMSLKLKTHIVVTDISFIYSSYYKSLFFLLLFSCLFLINKFNIISKDKILIFLVFICVLDISISDRYSLKFKEKGFLSQTPEFLKVMEKTNFDKRLYRFFSYKSNNDNENDLFYRITRNRNLIYALKTFSGYYSYFQVDLNLIQLILIDELRGLDDYEKYQVFKLASIRFVVNANNIKIPQKYFHILKKSERNKKDVLWEINDPEPIYSFKTKSAVFDSQEKIYEVLPKLSELSKQSGEKIDFSKVVFLINDDNYKKAINEVKKQKINNGYKNEVLLLDENPSGIKLEVKNNESGYVVIGNYNYKHWRAYDNDKEIPILTANIVQQALRVSAGKHVIRVEYYPAPLYKGIKFSFLGLILMLVQYLYIYKLNKNPKVI